MYQNKALKKVFSETTPIFKEPLTISQISFDKKPIIENHMLMCGDSATMIHPLCGNGMAMAIHSAKIVSEMVMQYFEDSNYERYQLESDYKKVIPEAGKLVLFPSYMWHGTQEFIGENTHYRITAPFDVVPR